MIILVIKKSDGGLWTRKVHTIWTMVSVDLTRVTNKENFDHQDSRFGYLSKLQR